MIGVKSIEWMAKAQQKLACTLTAEKDERFEP